MLILSLLFLSVLLTKYREAISRRIPGKKHGLISSEAKIRPYIVGIISEYETIREVSDKEPVANDNMLKIKAHRYDRANPKEYGRISAEKLGFPPLKKNTHIAQKAEIAIKIKLPFDVFKV